ncbi:tetratricopeptide repeat protein [Flavobacterium sp. Sd200]|uniref:tetratricopeptide repeat protein n=1 Tax=Flavobacterium sp. Sd200 TaxID=2692211 RepID=UPI001F2E2EC6|nr:tetratricopeptide repeat protein [Flavobacterium sp. Sd200]
MAQEEISAPLKVCRNLIEKGYKAKNTGAYTKALEYFSEAEILAENGQWQQELFDCKNNIGVVYVNLSNYEEARGYYQQALEIAEKDPKDNLFMVLNNIANTYSYEKDYQNALKYFKSAYNNPKAVNTDLGKIVMAINVADTYNKLGNFKQARAYLQAVEKLKRIKMTDRFWRINYAETFFIEGKTDIAEQMMLQLLQDMGNDKDADSYVYITELLSKIYTVKNNIEKAIFYAKKGLLYTHKPKGRIDLYNRLSDLYFKQSRYSVAAAYKDSVIVTKDSVAALFSKELFETNKIKLKIQRYQNELKINSEKQSAERTLFAIAIIFSLLLFFFIYRVLKNRLLKQKQEKIIAENQQKIVELELDHLQNSIAEKNRKLSAKALYLSGRNELIEEVINSVSKIKEVSHNEEVANYIKSLKGYLKADAEWDDFISYFEMVNPTFLSTLTTSHPQLNPADIRFICYLYMNLDLKEISNIFSITVEAAKKRKQRIAKKMEIEADELYGYILSLN